MGFPPLTRKATCRERSSSAAGKETPPRAQHQTSAAPHTPNFPCFPPGCASHLDVLRLQGSRLPGGGGCIIPGAQPRRPLQDTGQFAQHKMGGKKQQAGMMVSPAERRRDPPFALLSGHTVVLSSAQPPAYRHRRDSRLCRERLVSERDVDCLLGTQVDLGPKVITKVEHVLLQRCSCLRQLLEVPPLPRVQYDTGRARGRAVGESWMGVGTTPSSLCSISVAGGESAPNWGGPPV